MTPKAAVPLWASGSAAVLAIGQLVWIVIAISSASDLAGYLMGVVGSLLIAISLAIAAAHLWAMRTWTRAAIVSGVSSLGVATAAWVAPVYFEDDPSVASWSPLTSAVALAGLVVGIGFVAALWWTALSTASTLHRSVRVVLVAVLTVPTAVIACIALLQGEMLWIGVIGSFIALVVMHARHARPDTVTAGLGSHVHE